MQGVYREPPTHESISYFYRFCPIKSIDEYILFVHKNKKTGVSRELYPRYIFFCKY